MLNISAALKTEIADGRICRYALVTLTDATQIAITDFESSLTVGSVTFNPVPSMAAVQMLQTSDGQVSTQKIFSTWFQGYFTEADLVGGKYDDAGLEVGWIGWNMTTPERMVIFSGQMGEMSFSDEGVTMEALDDMKRLDKNIGRIYTANDPYTFGDAHWGLAEGSYSYNMSVGVILTPRLKFKISNTSFTTGTFSYGKITFTSGLNNGYSGEIKIHTKSPTGAIGSSFELFIPTPYPIATSDTFTVVAGYDGSFDQCKNKFNNVVNFGGFPHILPVSDA